MKRTCLIVLFTTLSVMLLGTDDSASQTFHGGLRGTVNDVQGVIPGATVTLTNQDGGVARETVSNDAGQYSFPAVDPGVYTVSVSFTGFRTSERTDVRIGTQQFLTLDIRLEVGSIQEKVTVTGEAPLIETSNASTGEVLDKRTLDMLPSISRMAYLVSNTVPTVVSTGNPHMNRMQDQTEVARTSLGGGASVANNYLLDGFPITDIQNRPSAMPSIEMLEDVKVQIHTYDSEMGRTGGGVFNATAKSGTSTASWLSLRSRPPQLVHRKQLLPGDPGPSEAGSVLAQLRRLVRRAPARRQDVLLGRSRGLPRWSDAERQLASPNGGRAERRFLETDRFERQAHLDL